MDMFAEPEVKKSKQGQKEVFPWELDEDMVTTEEHISAAEKATGKKLTKEGVVNGGLDMVFTYDNVKRVFERDTP